MYIIPLRNFELVGIVESRLYELLKKWVFLVINMTVTSATNSATIGTGNSGKDSSGDTISPHLLGVGIPNWEVEVKFSGKV